MAMEIYNMTIKSASSIARPSKIGLKIYHLETQMSPYPESVAGSGRVS
jgi:hypothetical protein